MLMGYEIKGVNTPCGSMGTKFPVPVAIVGGKVSIPQRGFTAQFSLNQKATGTWTPPCAGNATYTWTASKK